MTLMVVHRSNQPTAILKLFFYDDMILKLPDLSQETYFLIKFLD